MCCAPQGSEWDRDGVAAVSQLSTLRLHVADLGEANGSFRQGMDGRRRCAGFQSLGYRGPQQRGGVSQAAGRHFPGSEELKEDLGAGVMPSIDRHSVPLFMIVRETLNLNGEMFLTLG